MSATTQRLSGRPAIVTGAASGIGRAIALRLADEGAAVIVSDRQDDAGQETVRLIAARGGRARFVACDVADEASVREMIGRAAVDGLSILVNNAGIPGDSLPADTLDTADWDRVIAVNLRGPFLCCKYAIPHLAAAGHGAIVNIASIFGMVGAHDGAAYCASKGGVIALTQQLAVDLGPRGIRVNAVAPGFIDTDMERRRERMSPQDAARSLASREAAAALQPLGRQAQPSEVAAAVAFLASDDASFATGTILPIDGGCTAHFNAGER
jgi:NAD(P)-dependent dehydrogenase (short-subunit alcohol dehydrogenase family)